jgi:uncharacterized protein YecA (UPF0149 family)
MEDEDAIVNAKGEIIKRPAMNKQCPCNSKNRYKKCCYGKD